MQLTKESILIRKAIKNDSEALLDLIDALADYEKLQRPDINAKERIKIDAFGSSPKITAWLAEIKAIHKMPLPVAYAINLYTYSSFLALSTLYIEDIFVLPEYRSKGIGKALFLHCAQQALKEGCGRMDWQVLDWNKLAIDFYERAGAKHLKEWFSYRFTREDLEQFVSKNLVNTFCFKSQPSFE